MPTFNGAMFFRESQPDEGGFSQNACAGIDVGCGV
jgi:hypothetical protein